MEWTRRFVRFHSMRHPREMAGEEVIAFLDHLTNERDVAASTHNQALSALLFLCREVLGVELPWLGDISRPKRPRRLPAVHTRDEVRSVLALMEGTHALIARLLYGTGMRPMECVRLRVKDLDLARREIVVRHGKGGKDRVTVVPRALVGELRQELARARVLFDADRRERAPGLELPHALAVKYPAAGTSWGWFWVFPAPRPARALERMSFTAITCTRSRCSARWGLPCAPRASRSTPPRTRCGTRSPPTSSRRATTSGRCGSCSATRT